MKKILSMLIALMLMTAMLCGASAEMIKDGEFTINFCTWIGYAPLYIAEANGYFENYGINPTLTINEDESTYAAAMFSKSVSSLGQVLDREIISYASGTPEEVLLAMDESTGGDGLVACAEIQSIEDLKGKTVGLDTSSTAYFFFLTVLDSVGMTKDDVTIVDMDSDYTGPAFMAGDIDAAVTWEPFLSTAGEREGGHLLVSSADFPGTVVDVLTVRTDLSAEAKQALANAWFDAIDFLRANPEESAEIMAAGLELSMEDTLGELSGVTFFGREENAQFIDRNNEKNIYDVAESAMNFWLEEGIIDEEIDLDQFINAATFG